MAVFVVVVVFNEILTVTPDWRTVGSRNTLLKGLAASIHLLGLFFKNGSELILQTGYTNMTYFIPLSFPADFCGLEFPVHFVPLYTIVNVICQLSTICESFISTRYTPPSSHVLSSRHL